MRTIMQGKKKISKKHIVTSSKTFTQLASRSPSASLKVKLAAPMGKGTSMNDVLFLGMFWPPPTLSILS